MVLLALMNTVTTGAAGQSYRGRNSIVCYLYISPYKYWINLNIDGDQLILNLRAYSGNLTLVNNNLSGATAAPSGITGSTFNESLHILICSNGNDWSV